ncbi:hypothetical protein [Bradyrhizobium sp. McL0616]|uniref:hypothetical protein n=1 Tax=Bradyrhizobium sp. McL0616 TaxID=3415674 RepID=UPI003CF00D56
MIWGAWIDPNFKFKASDAKNTTLEFICYAVDATSLRERLDRKGLTVISIMPYDFSDWRQRAATYKDKAIWQRIKDRWSYVRGQASVRWTWLTPADLTEIDGIKKRLIAKIRKQDGCTAAEAISQIDSWSTQLEEETPAAGQTLPKTAISFNDNIWRELKWHLFELFHEKCAYCENKPRAGYAGDVEHYRPKGKVDEDENHPGYFWLAYDETNLLPSCSLCNQPRRAKQTRFPVKGAHSREARNLAREVPLLLNPYDRKLNPFDHLEFDATGFSAAHSEYGECSRDVYDLDRSELKSSRYDAMQLVETDWNTNVLRKGSITTAYADLRADILQGKREYSAAQLWALDRLKRRTVDELTRLPGV